VKQILLSLLCEYEKDGNNASKKMVVDGDRIEKAFC